MKIDLRERCKRGRCNKLILKNKTAQYAYSLYKPYCSYHCQQWNALEQAQAHINSIKESTK